MKLGMRALGAALATGVLLATAWASSAPLRVARSSDAIVRISLGARPERIETCVTQSSEELAKLAPQMRQSVVCEGTTARYRLEVRRNGKPVYLQTVRGGGLRHDRQLYVSRDLHVPSGKSSFTVLLARIDTVASEQKTEKEDHAENSEEDSILPNRADRDADTRRRRREEAIPAVLQLKFDAILDPNEVLLVSYEQETKSLTTKRNATAVTRRR